MANIDGMLFQFLRCIRCNVLNIHSALCREHHDGTFRNWIIQNRCIEFALDVRLFFDQHFLNDELTNCHAKNCCGVLVCFVWRVSELNAARLAAFTGRYLCLNDTRSEFLCCSCSRIRVNNEDTFQNLDPAFSEQWL